MRSTLIPAALAASFLCLPAAQPASAQARRAPAARVRAAADTSGAPAIEVGALKVTNREYGQALDLEVRRVLMGAGLTPEALPPEAIADLRSRAAGRVQERLVGALVLLHAAKAARVTVRPDSVEAAWREMTSGFSGAAAVDSALRAAGTTRAKAREEIRNTLMVGEFLRRRLGDVEVSETDARAFFEENRERTRSPETVRARHILIRHDTGVDALAVARGIKARLDGGEDFAALARELSQDPGSARRGGDLGPFTRGRMVPEFDAAAFRLPVGAVSDPVRTQFGYHLIRVDEHRAAQSPDFEEVEEQVYELVRRQVTRDRVDALVEELKRGANVRIHVPPPPAAPAPTPPGPAGR